MNKSQRQLPASFPDHRCGARVATLGLLNTLAREKKCVISSGLPRWAKRPVPAAVVINMTGLTLLRGFRLGLYEYRPGRNRDKAQFPPPAPCQSPTAAL